MTKNVINEQYTMPDGCWYSKSETGHDKNYFITWAKKQYQNSMKVLFDHIWDTVSRHGDHT